MAHSSFELTLSYGLPSQLCTGIKIFPFDPLISVGLDGRNSNVHSINVGVPQCSVLFPTLFRLHINDRSSNNIHSYANGYTLHAIVQYPSLPQIIQLELTRRSKSSSLSQSHKSFWDEATEF